MMTFCMFRQFVVYNTNINHKLWIKKVKTIRENQQQHRYSDYRDRQISEDVLESHEPKDHLHPNYCHWAWLPKPK